MIDKGVEAGRRVAAGDAAVGEVEGRTLEAEEGVVADARDGDEQRRRQTAFAARRPGSKATRPSSSVVLRGQNLVVAGDQAELDAGERLPCVASELHEGMRCRQRRNRR